MKQTRGFLRLPATVPSTRTARTTVTSTGKNRTAPAIPHQRTAVTARSGRLVLESPACPTPRHPAGREPSGSAASLAGARRPAGNKP